MAEYTLSNNAVTIDNSISRVANADTAPQANSANMVTSGGVHSAVNNIDLTNMASGVITTEADGIANFDTDANIPTNAAVKDYVDTKTLQSGVTDIPLTPTGVFGTGPETASGTATAAGFFLVGAKISQSGAEYLDGIEIIVGGLTYANTQQNVQASDVGSDLYMCVPVAKGEAYSISIQGDDTFARFKELS